MKKTFFSLLWTGVMTIASFVSVQAQISDTAVATFENLTLEAESYYLGADSLGFKEFRSGDFLFANTYNFGYWSGFGYANLTSSLYDTAASASYDLNTFRCAAGAGAQESATYALAYASDFEPAVVRTFDTTGQVIAGAYFVNSAKAVNSALYGDAFVTPFAQGDFMKVHCVGFLGKDTVGQTDLYLIDYRSKNPNEHYILQEWKWFDLSGLGKVNRVEFAVKSNQQNQFGELFPQYFCMDDFGITGTDDNPQDPTSNRFAQETLAVNLYPVPARGMLTLDIDRNDYNVEIFNLSGRPVKVFNHLNGETQLPVADLPAGMYLLRITSGGVTRTLRFVKA